MNVTNDFIGVAHPTQKDAKSLFVEVEHEWVLMS